jgi:hypothetical protein
VCGIHYVYWYAGYVRVNIFGAQDLEAQMAVDAEEYRKGLAELQVPHTSPTRSKRALLTAKEPSSQYKSPTLAANEPG